MQEHPQAPAISNYDIVTKQHRYPLTCTFNLERHKREQKVLFDAEFDRIFGKQRAADPVKFDRAMASLTELCADFVALELAA